MMWINSHSSTKKTELISSAATKRKGLHLLQMARLMEIQKPLRSLSVDDAHLPV